MKKNRNNEDIQNKKQKGMNKVFIGIWKVLLIFIVASIIAIFLVSKDSLLWNLLINKFGLLWASVALVIITLLTMGIRRKSDQRTPQ